MLLFKCPLFFIEKKQIHDELIRVLTLITIYFLLVELETISKKPILFSFKQVVNLPEYSVTRLLQDPKGDGICSLSYGIHQMHPDLIMGVPSTISNKKSPHQYSISEIKREIDQNR